MIENIVFDVGGVIVPLDRNRCIRAYESLGVRDFGKSVSDSRQKGFFADYENGDITSEEFRNIIRSMSNMPIENDSAIDEAMYEFLNPVYRETAEYIIELSKKYRLFILSNNNPIGWGRCRQLFYEACNVNVESVFEKIFLSFEMHQLKPDREIFETMIEKAGIEPSKTLYIDDAAKNIETAGELGFKTVLFYISKSLKEQISAALLED